MKIDSDMITEKIRTLAEKLKEDKKTLMIILMAAIGIILILFSGSGTSKSDASDAAVPYTEFADKAETEKSVVQMIESIKGAGRAKIMITYECDSETVFAKDTEQKSDTDETDVKNKHIIIDGDTGETGLKVKSIYPKVMGVAVICEGGEDPVVRERIYSLISALFDINTNSISVTVMA